MGVVGRGRDRVRVQVQVSRSTAGIQCLMEGEIAVDCTLLAVYYISMSLGLLFVYDEL